MKTMIAEKTTLLIVIGSQVLEPTEAWGRFGIAVGSFGSAMLLIMVAERCGRRSTMQGSAAQGKCKAASFDSSNKRMRLKNRHFQRAKIMSYIHRFDFNR
jgi:hypothetical protein